MMDKVRNTQNQIDKAIEDIENSHDLNFYMKKMTDIKKVVLDYLDENGELEKERRNLMKEYNHLIETPFKDEIINEIRKELRLKYPAMGIDELLHFSTNLYIFATLKVHNISQQEIVDKIMTLNNEFLNILQDQDNITIDREMQPPTLEYLQGIISKYEKIIKERI